MRKSIVIEENARINLRDGITLAADIYRPDSGGRFPAIIHRSYGRGYGRMTPALDELVNSGYVFINSEIRGRGGSQGNWDPSRNFTVEGPDGADTVQWASSQKWCDGNVGMMGISHAAFFQWMTAIQQPQALKAISPWTGDFNEKFVVPLSGGVISLLTTINWIIQESADMLNGMEAAGKDPSEIRSFLAWAAGNPAEAVYYLPFNKIPFTKYGEIGRLLHWRLNAISEPALKEKRQYEKVTVPCFSACGWFDPVAWVTFDNFNAMQKAGGSETARNGQYMVAGPWHHSIRLGSALGDIFFGNQADGAGSSVYRHQAAFFDRYLKGRDTEFPCVRYFLMGSNCWKSGVSWPLPQTEWKRFFLHSRGKANLDREDGKLAQEMPGKEEPDTYLYNPLDPVPTTGGSIIGALQIPGMVPGPIEQSNIEKRQDIACYTTAELAADIEISGPLQMHLFASTSARDTDFTARLVHVYPDGRAYNLADGIIRARGRKLSPEPEPVSPGEIYEFVITMGHTSQLFRRGHRLRLDISSSNFPQFDRNMNTGNPIGEDATGIVAKQAIYHEARYASYIDLPIIPGEEKYAFAS
jgi:uncharacterized protein